MNSELKNKLLLYVPMILIVLVPTILISINNIGNLGNTNIRLDHFICVLVKISVTGFFAGYIFNLFFKQETYYITDAKHLFAWQFTLVVAAKIFDLILVNIAEGNIQNLESEASFLVSLKFRWILLIFNVAPTFFFFIHVYSKVWANKLSKNEKYYPLGLQRDEVIILERKIEATIDLSFILVSGLLTILAPNYLILKMLAPIIMFPLVILGIITFQSLIKHQRLPQLNCKLMMIAYYIYIGVQIFRAFITEAEIVMFFEAFETITFLMMGLAFIIPPSYAIKKTPTYPKSIEVKSQI